MTSVWFLFEQKDRQQGAPLRRRLAQACREQAWSFAEREVRAVKDVEGRPPRLLTTRDADELYRIAHRDLVAVVDTRATRILRDPRDAGGRISARRTVRLRQLLRYKALLFERRSGGDADAAARGVVNETAALALELRDRQMADTDPRALPFLPFDLGARLDVDLELETDAGRERFEVEFGPPRRRRDAQSADWCLDPKAYHGRDALLVRGHRLPAGFHWDVEVSRGAIKLCMTAEVWQLRRNQYLNVYPDMYVRPTRAGGGRRVWPENK